MNFKKALSRASALAVSIVITSAMPLGNVSAQVTSPGSPENYIVLYKSQSLPSNAASTIKSAGGTILYSYPRIGVVIVQSSSSTFGSKLAKNTKVQAVSATTRFAVQTVEGPTSIDAPPEPPVEIPVTDSDTLFGLQWDMVQIHTPEAHAITGGNNSVVVGDIDSGIDYTHPDLAANVDFAQSVSCIGGVPNANPAAWFDDNGHGTHTAGTIAASANGIGIVGVAPNVKIAAIKAADANGFVYPDAVVCAFMWAGEHKIPVTNSSYFVDPYLFSCKQDATQRAIWHAIQRAILYAESRGTVVVASAGNFADDLAHPTQDITSPDDTSPIVRTVNNSCAVIPVEVQGVIGVSATGNLGRKSFYSNYGLPAVNVTAPGGDSILQLTAAAPNGRVLSTWPASLLTVTCLPARRVVDPSGATYCYQQGTSMSGPHVTGVAALVRSQGVTSRGAIAAAVERTADPVPCPTAEQVDDYAFFPQTNSGLPQSCTGGTTNSWHGRGQVNALSAISQ